MDSIYFFIFNLFNPRPLLSLFKRFQNLANFNLKILISFFFFLASSSKANELKNEEFLDQLSKEDKYTIVNIKALNVRYSQATVDRYMKPVIFQNGVALTVDDKYLQEQIWCLFNFKLELDEDTLVKANTSFLVNTVSVYSNNDKQSILSFEIFDFDKGKALNQTTRYAPYALQCSFSKSSHLSYLQFKQAVGDYLVIKREKKIEKKNH